MFERITTLFTRKKRPSPSHPPSRSHNPVSSHSQKKEEERFIAARIREMKEDKQKQDKLNMSLHNARYGINAFPEVATHQIIPQGKSNTTINYVLPDVATHQIVIKSKKGGKQTRKQQKKRKTQKK